MSHAQAPAHPRALSKLAAGESASVVASLAMRSSDVNTHDTLAAAKRAREARRSRQGSRAFSSDGVEMSASESRPATETGPELTEPIRQSMSETAQQGLASSSSSLQHSTPEKQAEAQGQGGKSSSSPRHAVVPARGSSMSFYRGNQSKEGQAAVLQDSNGPSEGHRERSGSTDKTGAVSALPSKKTSMSFRRAGSTLKSSDGGAGGTSIINDGGGGGSRVATLPPKPVSVPTAAADVELLMKPQLPRRSMSFHRDSSRNAAAQGGETNPLGNSSVGVQNISPEDFRRSVAVSSGSGVSAGVPPRSMSFRRAGSSTSSNPSGVLRKEGSIQETPPQNFDLARDVLPARSRSVRFSSEQGPNQLSVVGATATAPTADATSDELRIQCRSCETLNQKYAQLADELDHLERELRVVIREEQNYQADKEKRSWFGTRVPTGERGLLKTEINKLHVTVLYLYDRLEN